MKTLSSLGIGLSLVFGCLLLAFVAELYYLLWWKKRIASRDIEDGYSSSARELFHLLCSNKSSSLGSTELDPHSTGACNHDSDDQLLKSFGEDGLETEIMGLQNRFGPPRFLFTIKEETKEDLESDDGKSKDADGKSRKGSRGRSLSDLLLAIETPYMTPLSSPPFFTPPLTPLDYYHQNGLNPLFELSTDVEMSQIKASPPPKFKFLQDAEEKLYRKALVERAMKNHRNGEAHVEDGGSSTSIGSDEEDGSFITIIVGKSKNREQQHHHHIQHQHHSSSSQMLPLPSSPSNMKHQTS